MSPSEPGCRPARPFLKWAGGKRSLAGTIVERAPQRFARYHEPFLGGGAVFFAFAAADRVGQASLADLNADLIEAYTAVRDETEALIATLAAIERDYLSRDDAGRAEYYYARRAEQPESPVGRAARLIFLNRTGYNGLYRVNRKGQFNVPHGRYVRPVICDAANLRAVAAVLRHADLHTEDFEAACARAKRGDFVYLDPPYRPLSATAHFTAYTSGGFGPEEQERLRDAFEAMTRRGVAAMLSNSDHPEIRALYEGRGYAIETVAMGRAINSDATKRRAISELLIDNLGRPEVQAAFAC